MSAENNSLRFDPVNKTASVIDPAGGVLGTFRLKESEKNAKAAEKLGVHLPYARYAYEASYGVKPD